MRRSRPSDTPFGKLLLILAAVGVAAFGVYAFGVYAFVRARSGRM